MKSKLVVFALFIFTINIYGQEFVNGNIVTQRYDTISNVKIKKISDAKSLLHITYIDTEGNEQKPDMETIKCYERGTEIFCRIYNSGEMIMVKQITKGKKLNLFERDHNGSKTYYVEKVYDELIKVPASNGKFKKVLSAFLSESPQISAKIKSNELRDIREIVNLYNES
jgi:hypothetical protein